MVLHTLQCPVLLFLVRAAGILQRSRRMGVSVPRPL